MTRSWWRMRLVGALENYKLVASTTEPVAVIATVVKTATYRNLGVGENPPEPIANGNGNGHQQMARAVEPGQGGPAFLSGADYLLTVGPLSFSFSKMG